MPEETNDFWPDLEEISSVLTPVEILREQATALTKKTGYKIKGQVTTDASGDQFVHRLDLLVTRLDNYTYELLQIHYNMSLYPVTWYFAQESGLLEKEADLVAWLRQTLSSDRTRQVLVTLLGQVGK
jgi:hypothetical protein